MSGMLSLTHYNLSNRSIEAAQPSSPRTMAQLRARSRAPYCNICSYRQVAPMVSKSVQHRHNSAREVRIMQGVEFGEINRDYMCTTCMITHPARPEQGLNICLSTSQLHNIHHSSVPCPPDPLHIDWLTVCGATIADLEYAWLLDYKEQPRPMRILLSAGLNDLAKGKTRTDIVESILHFRMVVDNQNRWHPHTKNELVVATILNPPKLVWFPDNGLPPPNHNNLLSQIKELNSWIAYFNQQNGKITPRFHRFGVKNGWRINKDRKRVRVQCHQFQQWRQSEPVHDMLHLSDQWRGRMGIGVTRRKFEFYCMDDIR